MEMIFKGLLFALFIVDALLSLARVGGWTPPEGTPLGGAIAAVMFTLLAIGVWVYV